MFERHPDPYAGADLDTSRRFQAGLLGLCGLLALSFLPLEPVDDQIGAAGWPIAVALGLGSLGAAVAMARRRPSFDDLLIVAYAGIAASPLSTTSPAAGRRPTKTCSCSGWAPAHPTRRDARSSTWRP